MTEKERERERERETGVCEESVFLVSTRRQVSLAQMPCMVETYHHFCWGGGGELTTTKKFKFRAAIGTFNQIKQRRTIRAREEVKIKEEVK